MRGFRLRAAHALAILCASPAAGCARCDGAGEESGGDADGAGEGLRPLLGRLELRDRTPPTRHPAPTLTEEAMEEAVRATLGRGGAFEVAERGERHDRTARRATYRASVEVTFAHHAAPAAMAERGVGTAFVYLQVDRVSGGDGIESHGAEASADRPLAALERGDPNPFWAALLDEAAGKAFHVVAVQVAVRTRSSDSLIRDLQGDDVAVRQEAARDLGRRGERRALDDIAKLLDDPQQDAVLAAVGALTSLRDERAATHLIVSTRGRSDDYLETVIGALRTLGGIDAEAYLDTVATGHPSDDIKAKATAALLDVRARRYGGAARTAPP